MRFHPTFSDSNLGVIFKVLCVGLNMMNLKLFDASVITNILHIFDGFPTPPFAIIASHKVSGRVSDRSVALAASCSSVDCQNIYQLNQ